MGTNNVTLQSEFRVSYNLCKTYSFQHHHIDCKLNANGANDLQMLNHCRKTPSKSHTKDEAEFPHLYLLQGHHFQCVPLMH